MSEVRASEASKLGDVARRLQHQLVGRQREVEIVLAALHAGRHILIEGPPGTGKSTLLRGVAAELGLGFEFVEGNAELTPSRLVGHFDPARVLDDGYDPDVFVDGPLMTAMRDGSLLYVEEINRVPEETLNVLITVMSERELHVPRLGRVPAASGFRLVAAMNPFDTVGTARISSAVYDRVCRLAVGYQRADEEVTIVRRESPAADAAWVAKVVDVVRSTRCHPDLRVGSSVRGALDIAAVAASLGALRNVAPTDQALGLDAALVALSGRVRVREGVGTSSEEIITALWNDAYAATSEGDGREDGEPDGDTVGDAGKVSAPAGADRR
ncbi:MoxR family ATPase [soil metagenome]